jgi:preprotein translocase subunit YajC
VFISPAFAQEAASATAASAPSALGTVLPLLLVLVVFYFLVIRPQSARIQEHRKLIDSLQKGDKVVTGGGLIATVVRIIPESDEIVLKIADGVEVTALRSTISAKK